MKRSLLYFPLAFLLASTLSTSSADAQYKLSHQPQPYMQIEGGERLQMRWADTVNPYTYVDLGEEQFNFFGETFTLGGMYPLGISKWGNVEIRNANSAVIIDPFHHSYMDSLYNSTRVSMQVTGQPGDKVVRIEWKDMGFIDGPEAIVSFQLVMHQRTGKVEFLYGPHNIDCDQSSSVLQGAYVGMFIAPADFSSIDKVYWITGSPDDPRVSKMAIKAMKCVFPQDHAVSLASTASVDLPMEEAVDAGIIATTSLRLDATDVTIYTLLGQRIMDVHRTDGEILLSHLPRGRYFIDYTQDGERVRRALLLD